MRNIQRLGKNNLSELVPSEGAVEMRVKHFDLTTVTARKEWISRQGTSPFDVFR